MLSFQWPWMASIQIDQGQGFTHICGGSVIDTNLVLTAGHCLKDKDISELRIVFGTDDTSKTGSFQVERKISEIFIHPKYNQGESTFDMAVAILDEDLDLNDGISTVCIPTEANMDESQRFEHSATLIGWGATKPGEGPGLELCQAPMNFFASNKTINAAIICAGLF